MYVKPAVNIQTADSSV